MLFSKSETNITELYLGILLFQADLATGADIFALETTNQNDQFTFSNNNSNGELKRIELLNREVSGGQH